MSLFGTPKIPEPDYGELYSTYSRWKKEDKVRYRAQRADEISRMASSGLTRNSSMWNSRLEAIDKQYAQSKDALREGATYQMLNAKYEADIGKDYWDAAAGMGYVNEDYQSNYEPGGVRVEQGEEGYYGAARQWVDTEAEAGNEAAVTFRDENTFDAYMERNYGAEADLAVKAVGKQTAAEKSMATAKSFAGGGSPRGGAPAATGSWLDEDEDQLGWLTGGQ